jgi:competence protein ComEC
MKLIRPLVFYGTALYIGCISYIFYTDIKLLGAVLAASFLIIILVTVEKKFSLLVICFFFTGIFSSLIYYDTNSIGSIQHIRIVKNKGYYAEGLVNGKNVIVKGNIGKLEDQDVVITNGKFQPDRDCYKGTVGTIYISSSYSVKKDMISHIFELKRSLHDKFAKTMGEEKAALIMSLCFGESRYLSDEQKYDFQKLGVVHAISVSGFHMAIIYKLLENIAGFQISILLSLLYMIFTGRLPVRPGSPR